MRRLMMLAGLAVAVAGCTDRSVVAPEVDAASTASPLLRSANAASDIVVMSQNMYVGAPVEPILDASDTRPIPVKVAEAWAILVATDYPARARALAAEIAKVRPHLVGLQEVSLLRYQTPGDLVLGGTTPAETVAYDFLPTLLAELDALGVHYRVAAIVENTDIELPRLDGFDDAGNPQFSDIRLTDYDAVLAREDVATANETTHRYQATLPVPGTPIEVLRGFAAADADVGGTWYRFISTHLESDYYLVRNGQAQELAYLMSGETMPLIVVGDFNSGPGRVLQPGEEPAYDFLLAPESMGGGGFTDVWTQPSLPSMRGNSCCHVGDLSNKRPGFTQRIDLVLTKNIMRQQPWQTWFVNDQVGDLRTHGVWLSDHAGMFARLRP
jgi:endonuclease/exonuclease/phosphatase family metal-dependent hydrolase